MGAYSVSRTDLSVEGVRFRKIVHVFTVLPMWWERAGSKCIIRDSVEGTTLREGTGC